LSTPDKLQFFVTKLKILGHVIDEKGIVMDPNKVDQISKWKTPTNWDLLLQFVGAAGYLAENFPNLWIDCSVLSTLTVSTALWRWGPTQQCAGEAVKNTIKMYRDSHCVAIDYGAELSQRPSQSNNRCITNWQRGSNYPRETTSHECHCVLVWEV
jgi:hypothetical protein